MALSRMAHGEAFLETGFEGNARYGYGICLDEIEVSGIPDTFSVVSVSATDSDASEAGPDVGTWNASLFAPESSRIRTGNL